MNVRILCIGDELLIGQVVNTNAAWLGEQLTGSGFRVVRITDISDRTAEIVSAIEENRNACDVLIMTGGLGPTSDDRTRDALCTYLHCGMRTDPVSVENITRIFQGRGLPVTEINLRQAEVPEKCEPLNNPIGTSPGMWHRDGDKILIALPGVPFEMKKMFSETVLPRLNALFHPEPYLYRTVLTQGMGESFLSDRLQEWERALPDSVTLAYLPSPGIVKLRLMTVRANSEALQEQIGRLSGLIPELIFGYDDDTLEALVGKLLAGRNATLSAAESCTGGYIAHLITSVPGSSRYFKGSVVAYDNDIKVSELGVSSNILEKYGAVSKETVIEMAEGIRKRFRTDFSVAVSGIAGPDGGTAEKPVGTVWIAVSAPDETVVLGDQLGGDRGRHIRRTALTALNLLRKELIRRAM